MGFAFLQKLGKENPTYNTLNWSSPKRNLYNGIGQMLKMIIQETFLEKKKKENFNLLFKATHEG